MLDRHFEDMFKHQGKTVKIIGKTRVKTYRDLYRKLTELQSINHITI